jgi:uncharacterized protein
MKFLLVLAVVLVAFWIWRSNRAADRPPSQRRGPDPTKAIDMVVCKVCGVHCPKTDAVAGRLGMYCTAQHRGQAEP